MLTTQCRYDLANRLIGTTYPSGLVASYTRDAQGRVNGVSLARGTWALPLVTQVGYQPFGPMSSIAFGHGQTLAKQWDRNYEPDAITSPALDYDYTLDDVGNLTRIQSAIEGEQRYGYDNLDRLQSIREQNEALIESFAYDATGNRTSHTVGASTTSYSYPGSSHRLEQVGAQARAFDAAGNTLSGIAGSSFAFDARNRLVEVNAGGAIRQRMNYNGRGERVLSAEGNPAPAWPTTSSAWAQAAAAGVRAMVYDEQGQVLSTLRGGNPLRFEEIVWIDSTPVARVESSTSAVLTVHAIHTDHLNTPRALVNAQTQGGQPAGTVIWRWRLVNQGTSGSNAFGAMAAEEDPDGNGTTVRFDLRFPGQQYDASTGLHYNYFRDYEAQTGRYVESDPIGLRGGVGTYVYALSIPLIAVDPSGEAPICAAGPWGAAACACAAVAVWSYRAYRVANAVSNATASSCNEATTSCEPDCDELNHRVQEAKARVAGFGRNQAACRSGMSQRELASRESAWLDLARARARRDVRCWNGGDRGHQMAQADAWTHVGNCQSLLNSGRPL